MIMRKYEKPIIEVNNELAEGVYAASGTAYGTKVCDSKYMNGVWQGPDYRPWAEVGGSMGYMQYYGCLGCPANTYNGCGIADGNHYEESGNAGSYDTDKGKRMPRWEAEGKDPNETVSDFGLGG